MNSLLVLFLYIFLSTEVIKYRTVSRFLFYVSNIFFQKQISSTAAFITGYLIDELIIKFQNRIKFKVNNKQRRILNEPSSSIQFLEFIVRSHVFQADLLKKLHVRLFNQLFLLVWIKVNPLASSIDIGLNLCPQIRPQRDHKWFHWTVVMRSIIINLKVGNMQMNFIVMRVSCKGHLTDQHLWFHSAQLIQNPV